MMMKWLFSFLFLSSLSHVPIIQSRCNHQAEHSALLQFKDSFQINCTNDFGDDLGYPKTSSWNINGTGKWDGVECDAVTGHVIGLDLSSSCLHGSINSNSSSSIFSHLVHLEYLDLAYNDFQGSSIPSELSNMSSLRYLLLDDCGLKGEFSQGIFYLPKLQHLSIQWNPLEGHLPTEFNSSTTPLFEFLLIRRTNFKGTIPVSIGNLIALRVLDLSLCRFSEGSVPSSLGNLTHLTRLGLSSFIFTPPSNNFTTMSWLGKLTNLRYLDISEANLIGEIPHNYSLSNLTHLSLLDLRGNTLTGQIPSFLTKFAQLEFLAFSDNQLTGETPLGLFNLTKLLYVDVSNNTLHGPLPIQNLRNLKYLDVSKNTFTEPLQIQNMRNLEYLDVSKNTFTGPLQIQNLKNLEYLDVRNNQLSGTLKLDLLLELTNLTILMLSSNKLTLLAQQQRNVSTSSTLPKFRVLGLSSCQMFKFPEFLQYQQYLMYLDVSNNSIDGSIPKWMGSIKSLKQIDMSHNFITTLDDPHLFLQLPNLHILDISFNKLRGLVPVPSPSVAFYRASNNELTGQISRTFCNLPSLQLLDFSTNRLTGELDPYCFRKSELSALSLQKNSFHGKIPAFCANETNSFMTMIDLNSNQFQGKIPRSLANCAALEFFDAGSNFINDTFPSWLGSLSLLKVLILKDNALHGSIETMPKMRSGYWFPELIIIDISRNNLSGNLTSWHFERWMAMKTTHLRNPSYMGKSMSTFLVSGAFYYSITIYNKGTETEYLKISNALITIDLSSNGFEGEVPSTIGDLRGIHFLNLSSNHLNGHIPSSLGNLKRMESLDLSSNRISGKIPQQLTGLDFLTVVNLSHNNLIGLITQGRHFDTFPNISYLGNPGLCGAPLSRKCGPPGQEAPQPPENMVKKEYDFWDDLSAKTTGIACH